MDVRPHEHAQLKEPIGEVGECLGAVEDRLDQVLQIRSGAHLTFFGQGNFGLAEGTDMRRRPPGFQQVTGLHFGETEALLYRPD